MYCKDVPFHMFNSAVAWRAGTQYFAARNSIYVFELDDPSEELQTAEDQQ